MQIGAAVSVVVGMLMFLFGYFRRTSMESNIVRGIGGSDESSLILMGLGCVLIVCGLVYWMIGAKAGAPAEIKCPKCDGSNFAGDPKCRYCGHELQLSDQVIVAAAQTQPVPAGHGLADQIERLSTLRHQGSLTEVEYQAAKSKLLG